MCAQDIVQKQRQSWILLRFLFAFSFFLPSFLRPSVVCCFLVVSMASNALQKEQRRKSRCSRIVYYGLRRIKRCRRQHPKWIRNLEFGLRQLIMELARRHSQLTVSLLLNGVPSRCHCWFDSVHPSISKRSR